MASPDPLKSYRLYVAMFLLNLAVVVGIIYFLRRTSPQPMTVSLPTPRAAQTPVAQITIAINGAVKQPGIYSLGSDAQLADAIQKAGGALAQADLSQLDLTDALTNGEQIEIPVRTAAAPAINNFASQPPTPPLSKSKINLNTATLQELESLPSVGPALAQRVIDYRNQNGAFKSVADIKAVRGIGDAIYQKIEEMITVQ